MQGSGTVEVCLFVWSFLEFSKQLSRLAKSSLAPWLLCGEKERKATRLSNILLIEYIWLYVYQVN